MPKSHFEFSKSMNLTHFTAFLAAICAFGAISLSAAQPARATEDNSGGTLPPTLSGTKPHASPSATPQADSSTTTDNSSAAPSTTASAPADAELQNNRVKALEGSKSPWSFQANLTYSGSSINHPLAETVPNAGGSSQPPKVQLGGTIAARYRLDDVTSIGFGTGILTYTPFQGPSGTSVSDPVIDIQRSYKIGKIHNRADFAATGYTDNEYGTQIGYAAGLTALNEAYYIFPFGLTTGFLIQVDYNIFKGKAGYPVADQTMYDMYTDPYFEFILSKHFNLRSVIGIQALGHQNDMTSPFAQYHQKIYQTLGVGISPSNVFYIYPYVVSNSYDELNTRSVTFGFNTVINLF
jgi:hypothetical protein